MIVSKKTLMNLVDNRIRKVISDKTLAKIVAMEYLTGLTKAQLNRFNEAVELRRQSEAKLEKLEEIAPDLVDLDGMEYELGQ